MRRFWFNVFLPPFLAAITLFMGGCPVYQEPGQGKELLRTCRKVSRDYWLYIPKPHNPERRYPLVVTLHGMKPYDSARPHVQMWGKLADQHQYIVVAPVLMTSDSFGQFPLRKMGPAEMEDVRAVLAIMDEVEEDWEIDPHGVLLSSWSMGGYLASYVLTEYGDRFTAYAPLESNFHDSILNAAHARRWAKSIPVFMFYGSVDLNVVTSQVKDSIAWFRAQGYTVQTKDAGIGHERHPELAAQFFEQVLAQQRRDVEIVVTPPSGVPAPLAINLWPALSSRIADVRTYVWDFGRLAGGPSYQKSPNVLIRQPGDYPITLTVIDSKGQRHITSTVLRVPSPSTADRNPSATPYNNYRSQ
ncbi:MAG: hypothetical protein BIFFINMI_01907 [Phycisphaerae bacterium]|nr:hypothetical protein [Phycisphaerae bacterium]